MFLSQENIPHIWDWDELQRPGDVAVHFHKFRIIAFHFSLFTGSYISHNAKRSALPETLHLQFVTQAVGIIKCDTDI